MKNWISIILIVLLPLISYAQTGELAVITAQIALDGSLGFDENHQYNRFLKLQELASNDELVKLTDHLSPAVRGYAFWALAKNHYPDLKSIFIKHLDDQVAVIQRNGCMVGNESVISFMKQVVTPYMYDRSCKKLDDETLALVK